MAGRLIFIRGSANCAHRIDIGVIVLSRTKFFLYISPGFIFICVTVDDVIVCVCVFVYVCMYVYILNK